MGKPGPKPKRETRQCAECGAGVTRRPCEFKSPLAFCGRKCSMAHHNRTTAAKKSIIKVCAHCGEPFKLRRCQDFRKFCSQACMGKSRKKVEVRVCAGHGGEFVVKRDNPNSKYCSSECYNKQRERGMASCKMCGVEYVLGRNKERTCSDLCAGRLRIKNTPPEVMAAKKKKLQKAGVDTIVKLKEKYGGKFKTVDTPIELALQDELTRRGIAFKTQIPLLDMTVVDIFIEPNICIYADVMLWHNLPTSKTRDDRNNAALRKAGHKVFRFTGKEIHADAKSCIDKVLSVLPDSTL
jgi:very-short-patch-repair endonuclease